MEPSTCVKAVVLAMNQYRKHSSEDSLVNLIRQLDVLISITKKGSSLGFFSPTAVLPVECLSCLVGILCDPQTKTTLANKALTLLNNLASSRLISETLQSRFNLISVLSSYLRFQQAVDGTLGGDTNVCQCIQLLHKITYRYQLTGSNNISSDLMHFLLRQIEGKETVLTWPCLGVVSNLCQSNPNVMQMYIKSMGSVRGFYKSLIQWLTHNNNKVKIFALSIAAHLCVKEENLWQSFFSAQNVLFVFNLLFEATTCRQSTTVRCTAVDLFIYLLQHGRMQESLVRFPHLESSVKQLLYCLVSADPRGCFKLLELLLAMCRVSELRHLIRSLIFQQLRVPNEKQGVEPIGCVLHCMGVVCSDGQEDVCIKSLELLRLLYEDMLTVEHVAIDNLHINKVLPALVRILDSNQPMDLAALHRLVFRQLSVVQLLSSLCASEVLRDSVANAVDVGKCVTLIERNLDVSVQSATLPLNTNGDVNGSSSSRGGCSGNSSAIHSLPGVAQAALDLSTSDNSIVRSSRYVVTHCLDLMIKLGTINTSYTEVVRRLLQDCRFIAVLATCLASSSQPLVNISIQLLISTGQLEQFSTDSLAECLVSLSSSVLRSDETEISQSSHTGSAPHYTPPVSTPTSTVTGVGMYEGNGWGGGGDSRLNLSVSTAPTVNSDLDNTVQSIIDRLQKDLKITDLRAAEVMTVYEHRLQSLQTKESSLQKALETKCAALAQSDLLITEYHARIAQCEAEGVRIRSLLCDYERRCEELTEKQASSSQQLEKTQAELEQLSAENNRLAKARQHLDTLKQEHRSLSEVYETCRRQLDTLSKEHQRATQKLSELSSERVVFSRQIKEKDDKLLELEPALLKVEQSLKKTTKEKDELETALDKLRQLLTQKEQSLKELQCQGARMQTLLCDYERRCEELTEKQASSSQQLEKTQAELEQLSAENNSLRKVAEEYKHFQATAAKQDERLETLSREMSAMRLQQQQAVEQLNVSRKQYDALKVDLERSVQQLAEVTEARASVTRRTKELEERLTEADQTLKKSEEWGKKLRRENEEQEQAIDELRRQLMMHEKDKKDLQYKISSLEIVCEQKEKQLKEKEELIAEQKAELDKHSQIAALIHNLSGGKVPAASGANGASK